MVPIIIIIIIVIITTDESLGGDETSWVRLATNNVLSQVTVNLVPFFFLGETLIVNTGFFILDLCFFLTFLQHSFFPLLKRGTCRVGIA